MITRTFFQAFKERYLDSGDLDLEELTIKQKYTKDLVVELVGREKAIDTFKNLKNLKQIVLSNCLIQFADQSGVDNHELKSSLKTNQSIRLLDISYNQIDSWMEIVSIVEFFPFLEELIITGNPLKSIEIENLDRQIKVFNKIKSLISGKLKISWSSIELFDKLFTNLRSLNIFNSNLTDLQLSNSTSFLNVNYLSLSENQINWSQVLQLNLLKNLTHLQLDSCKIDEIHLMGSDLFNNLKQLNLSNNQLSKWSDVSELSKLNNLTDLSIRDNPFSKDQDYDLVFNFVVGILKNLKILNKQLITKDKRNEAEIYFLRTNYKAWSNNQLKEWKIEKRFEELIDVYGKPVDLLKEVQINKFININLTDEKRTFKKKFLKSMDIITLRVLAKRLFNLDNQTDFDLWYSNDDKDLEFKLDKEKILEFYPINDNCTIKVKIRSF